MKTNNWKRNLVLLWLCQILVMTGFSGAMPFIPLYLERGLGIAGEDMRGLYMAFFYFFGVMGYALFCPIWGNLSDRFGVKIMLLRGTFITAFIFPLMGVVNSVWALIGLRFLTAACAGTTNAANILVAKYTPENKQGFALGSLSTAFWCGSMMGNVLGGFIVEHFGYMAAFTACGITYLLAGFAVIFVHEDFRRSQPQPGTTGVPAPDAAPGTPAVKGAFTFCVLSVLCFLALWHLVMSISAPYLAMLVEKVNGADKAASITGIISACAAVGSVLSGLIYGFLADRVSGRFLSLTAITGAGVTLIFQGLAGNILTLGIHRSLQSFFCSGLQPVILKTLSGITAPSARGKVLGWSSTFGNVGVMLSTIVFGGLIYWLDIYWVNIVAGIFTLMLIPAALPIMGRAEKEKNGKRHESNSDTAAISR